MAGLLSIGAFSQSTHLSVKALRHYDRIGLLEPAAVDPTTSYRSYSAAQVPTALLIGRLRGLEMPLDEVGRVLAAPDPAARDAAIAAHLERMEQRLADTQQAVASLRMLLRGEPTGPSVERRGVGPISVLALRAVVDWDDTYDWLGSAFEALWSALGAAGVAAAGAEGALYSPEFFESHRGEVVAFVPITPDAASAWPAGAGPVSVEQLPAATLAVATHRGPFAEIDQTYGALGAAVAEGLRGAGGPIREHYLSGAASLGGPELHAEVCWPIDA
jgi:DNA-binding transcriptional MerR regulator/effector-binding domain-containing protein